MFGIAEFGFARGAAVHRDVPPSDHEILAGIDKLYFQAPLVYSVQDYVEPILLSGDSVALAAVENIGGGCGAVFVGIWELFYDTYAHHDE
eukprot:TRINITY_DN8126_c0_g1_i1.p1 TRINITY_DN8126_c0_g1~~TRINITY_DN8126_c0_g1_i1.p1  ORF type:complete len:90 (+),score=12.06 TRINITY_DN8126_c0_g1_i1:88-357(+)